MHTEVEFSPALGFDVVILRNSFGLYAQFLFLMRHFGGGVGLLRRTDEIALMHCCEFRIFTAKNHLNLQFVDICGYYVLICKRNICRLFFGTKP